MTQDLKISLTERDEALEALTNLANVFHEGRAKHAQPESKGYVTAMVAGAESAIVLLQLLQPAAQVAAPEAGIVHPVPVSGEGAMPPPAIGDYVLATKYHDGDPGDNWALGFYDGVLDTQGRHYVKDSAGRQIRGNGFRRVARVRPDVGRWMLEVAAKQLEACPPGTVNLWTMLTPAAFEVDASPSADNEVRGEIA